MPLSKLAVGLLLVLVWEPATTADDGAPNSHHRHHPHPHAPGSFPGLQMWIAELSEHARARGRPLPATCAMGNLTFPRWSPDRVVHHIHIPKAAGASAKREIGRRCQQARPKKLLFRSGQKCWSDENWFQARQCNKLYCITRTDKVVFVRSPRPHVHSQFLECRYDPWAIGVTKTTGFPRNQADNEDYLVWLDNFVELNDSQVGSKFDFNCQDPRNLATRHLSCDVAQVKSSGSGHPTNHAQWPPPDLALALANLRRTTFVGVADMFSASVCLAEMHLSGNVSAPCLCRSAEQPDLVHERHGVPEHDDDLGMGPLVTGADMAAANGPAFASRVAAQVRRLTGLDMQVFNAGLLHFLCDVHAAQRALGQAFLCPREVADKRRKFRYTLDEPPLARR